MYKNKISKILFGIFIGIFSSFLYSNDIMAGSNMISEAFKDGQYYIQFEFESSWWDCSKFYLQCSNDLNKKVYPSIIEPGANTCTSSYNNKGYNWATGYFDVKELLSTLYNSSPITCGLYELDLDSWRQDGKAKDLKTIVIAEIVQKINDYQYALNGAGVNGSIISKGEKLKISYCNKISGICEYEQRGSIKEKGYVYANKLSSQPVNDFVPPAKDDKQYVYGYMYLQEGYEVAGETHLSTIDCGIAVYIDYCDNKYCYYYNHETKKNVKVNESGLTNDKNAAAASCGISESDPENIVINKTKYALYDGDDYSCGDALYITTCKDDFCNYELDNGEVGTIKAEEFANKSTAQKTCEERLNAKKCDNKYVRDNKGTNKYTVCFDEESYNKDNIINEIRNHYICADGYKLDDRIYSESTTQKGKCQNNICYKTYEVTCSRVDGKYKPTLEVSSGNIGSDGRTGVINVHAKSAEGRIAKYYVSSIYKTPTDTTTGWIEVNSDSFTITKTPGIYYIWVKDIKDNISHGIGGAVFDTVNADTTINKLEIQDSNGGIQNPLGNTAYKVEGITNSSYVRLSNNLINNSVLAENGFNPYTMEYKIEVDTPTISVYATLTSSDSSYVNGYEPRTVNLDYGMNTVLIKIQNKEGKVRTYTILVNRKDSRTADNTLSDLSIDVGKIEFNSNKTEYKIEIPVNTEKVNVNAIIGNDKASFVDGYKPGIVNIVGDTTVKFIKVQSETGSTRTYVLTFIKEKTDEIKKENLMLSDLVIPGVYVAFEEEIANYNISVAYEEEIISLYYELKDSDSSAIVYLKGKNDSEYKISSNKGIKLDVGENFVEIKVTNKDGEESFYRLTIIRKEFGLGISNDTTLRDLKVLGYEINYEPNKKEYTVKIKQEKSLVITAIPNSDRSEVFIRGNDELTGFSTVRVKVVAENGEFDTYSIDIKKDAFNKTIEIAAIIAGVVIILGSSCIIVIKNKNKKNKEYYEE